MFGRHMTLLALKKPGSQNYYSLVRPNTGESYFDMEVSICTKPFQGYRFSNCVTRCRWM